MTEHPLANDPGAEVWFIHRNYNGGEYKLHPRFRTPYTRDTAIRIMSILLEHEPDGYKYHAVNVYSGEIVKPYTDCRHCGREIRPGSIANYWVTVSGAIGFCRVGSVHRPGPKPNAATEVKLFAVEQRERKPLADWQDAGRLWQLSKSDARQMARELAKNNPRSTQWRVATHTVRSDCPL